MTERARHQDSREIDEALLPADVKAALEQLRLNQAHIQGRYAGTTRDWQRLKLWREIGQHTQAIADLHTGSYDLAIDLLLKDANKEKPGCLFGLRAALVGVSIKSQRRSERSIALKDLASGLLRLQGRKPLGR